MRILSRVRARPGRPVRVLWALLLWLGAGGLAPARPAGDEDPLQEMRRGLATLWSGSPAEKRAVADDAWTMFRVIGNLDATDPDTVRAMASLRDFVRVEVDDWIVTLLLDKLYTLPAEMVNPLYRSALQSGSVNVKARAFKWFSFEKDPEVLPLLLEAWDSSLPDWARVRLVQALGNQNAPEQFDEFLDLGTGDNPDLATAAIVAMGQLGDPRAVPTIAKVARHGAPGPRRTAVAALAAWSGSAEALAAVLDAARSGDDGVAYSAVGALREFPAPEATDSLLDLARDGVAHAVRAAAIEVLSHRPDPGIAEALAGMLLAPPPEESGDLVRSILRALDDLDDPGALAILGALDPDLRGGGSSSVGDLVTYLSRDRSKTEGDEIQTVCACGRTGLLPPPEPGGLRVAFPGGMRTVRCWVGPAVAGNTRWPRRVPAGTPVRIIDHFDRGGELWVDVDFSSRPGCWLPMSDLEEADGEPLGHPAADVPATPPGDGAPEAEPSPFRGSVRFEFDLPADEIETDAARALLDAGLMETFDPADGVSGAALEVYPSDREVVCRLARTAIPSGTMLEAQMAVFLGGIRSLRGNDIMNDCAPGPLQSQRLFEPFASPSQP